MLAAIIKKYGEFYHKEKNAPDFLICLDMITGIRYEINHTQHFKYSHNSKRTPSKVTKFHLF